HGRPHAVGHLMDVESRVASAGSFVSTAIHRASPCLIVGCAGSAPPARPAPPTAPPRPGAAPGAARTETVHEPVRSYRKPAAAGPRAAPHRQPRFSTPRIAPSARVPKTSGTALASIVSAAAKPTPSATSDARRAP